jgi:thiol-disulfide isomerase/thioredoxin
MARKANETGMDWRLIWLSAAIIGALFGPVDGVRAEDPAVQSVTVKELQTIIQAAGSRAVVVVMAAWCAPCILELPDLVAIHRKHKGDGLNLFGLSIDYAGPEPLEPILKEHRVTFPVYWTGEAAIEAYDIRKIPLLMMIKDGQVVERLVGMRPPKQLEAAIVEFIK